jgi:twinkle protein
VQLLNLEPIDLADYIDAPVDAHRVIRPVDLVERVIERARRGVYGATLPWSKTHKAVRFPAHQITVWGGPMGSWKSSCLSHCAISWAEQGERVCITSLEEPLDEYQFRQAQQMHARDDVSDSDVRKAAQALSADRMWFWDAEGEMTAERAVAMMRYCAKELRITQFMFDNVTNVVDPSNDNTSEQWRFMRSAHRLARDSGMHVHLVMHTKKDQGDYMDRPPRAGDLRGSGSIPQMADNVLMFWRNMKKEDRIAEDGISDELAREADLTILVEKAKFTRWRGRVKLWNQRAAWQFVEHGHDIATASRLMGGA